MAFFTFPPPEEKTQHHKHQDGDLIILMEVKPTEKLRRKPRNNELKPNPKPPSSWDSFKNILTCKQAHVVPPPANVHAGPPSRNVLGSCGSICSFRDVVVAHGGSAGSSRRVVHRSDDESPDHSRRSLGNDRETGRLHSKKTGSRRDGGVGSSSRWSLASSSSRRMHLRKLSGCYECQAIVDPTRCPMPRTTICTCPDCGDVFPKIESLEHHRAVKHAVTELGPEDSSRNIVEIIFKSSWLKKDTSVCNIQRILKVHNTPRTIQRFEDYRDAVKQRAAVPGKKNPRCAADGNELLRFYCTTLTCALGASGSSSLCGSFPGCRACTIIRHGFHGNKPCGIRTTASSGRAHDSRHVGGDRHVAILVCRVIAGRVGRTAEEMAAAAAETGSFDSVADVGGSDPNLEELLGVLLVLRVNSS